MSFEKNTNTIYSITDFYNWLKSKKKDEVIGSDSESINFPLCNFIKEKTGAKTVKINMFSMDVDNETYCIAHGWEHVLILRLFFEPQKLSSSPTRVPKPLTANDVLKTIKVFLWHRILFDRHAQDSLFKDAEAVLNGTHKAVVKEVNNETK